MSPEVAAAWVAVAVAALATIAAFIGLRYASRAARAATEQTELQRQIALEARLPMLWADIKPHPEHRSMIGLFLGNRGPTVAHDVTLTIDPPIVPGEQPLKCLEAQRAAAAGVAAIPPDRTYEWYVGVGHELIAAPGQPEAFTLTIQGRASDGTALHESFTVPLEAMRYTSAAAGSFESMARSLDHLVTGLTGKGGAGRPLRRHVERIADTIERGD